MISECIISWQEDIDEIFEMEIDEAEDPLPDIDPMPPVPNIDDLSPLICAWKLVGEHGFSSWRKSTAYKRNCSEYMKNVQGSADFWHILTMRL